MSWTASRKPLQSGVLLSVSPKVKSFWAHSASVAALADENIQNNTSDTDSHTEPFRVPAIKQRKSFAYELAFEYTKQPFIIWRLSKEQGHKKSAINWNAQTTRGNFYKAKVESSHTFFQSCHVHLLRVFERTSVSIATQLFNDREENFGVMNLRLRVSVGRQKQVMQECKKRLFIPARKSPRQLSVQNKKVREVQQLPLVWIRYRCQLYSWRLQEEKDLSLVRNSICGFLEGMISAWGLRHSLVHIRRRL